MERELDLLSRVKVILALGKVGFDATLKILEKREGTLEVPRPAFAHRARVPLGDGRTLLASYHPSRQNTQTGRLTRAMFHRVFREARALLEGA